MEQVLPIHLRSLKDIAVCAISWCRGAAILTSVWLLAVGCSKEQTTTSSPVVASAGNSDFAGIWQLNYEVVRCDSARPWHCPSPGSTGQISLRVDQGHGQVTALALSDSLHVPLAGEVGSSSELVLQGIRRSVSDEQGTQEIRGMRVRRKEGGGLSGLFQIVTRSVPVPTAIVAQIIRAQWVGPLAFTDASGEWVGSYVVDSCAVEIGKTCGPDPLGFAERLTVSLRQSANSVVGTVRLGTAYSVEVSGTVSGQEIVLSGSSQQSTNGFVTRIALDQWISRRDRLGQMEGTFRRQWAQKTILGESASTAQVRLSYVARR
jgi:hypothetical protein